MTFEMFIFLLFVGSIVIGGFIARLMSSPIKYVDLSCDSRCGFDEKSVKTRLRRSNILNLILVVILVIYFVGVNFFNV